MSEREKYVGYAADSIALGLNALDAAERVKFLEMAQAWRRVADDSGRIEQLVEEAKTLKIDPARV